MSFMQVQYGNYAFQAGSCKFGLRQAAILNAAQFPYAYQFNFDVEGRLYGEGDAALSVAENNLRAALAIPFQNVGVLRTNGQPSATYFYNAKTIGGIVVTEGPTFSGTHATEYVLFRDFRFTASFKVPVLNARTAVIEYADRMEYSGGFPEFVHKRAYNAPPQKQLVWFQTEFKLIQSGRAVGFLDYPNPAPMAFPGALKTSPVITHGNKERIGNNYWKYPIEWRYEFEANYPLNALPTFWV